MSITFNKLLALTLATILLGIGVGLIADQFVTYPGERGLKGEQGAAGVGLNGRDGQDGSAGPQGEVGLTGPTGTSGDTADSQLSSNVALLDRNSQTFTGNNQLFKNNTDSASAFQVQDAGGVVVLNVDTINSRVGINTANPQTSLDLGGGSLTLNGADTSGFDLPGLKYVETGRMDMGWGGFGGGNFELYSKGHASRQGQFRIVYGGGDFGDIRFIHYNGTSFPLRAILTKEGNFGIGADTPTAMLDVRGNALFKNTADSTTAFRVQNAAGADVVLVDTTNKQLTVNGAANEAFRVKSPTTTYFNVNTNTSPAVEVVNGATLNLWSDGYITRQLRLKASDGRIEWGSSADTVLYRTTTGGLPALRTDQTGGLLVGGTGISGGRIGSITQTTAGNSFTTFVSGETQNRFVITAAGKHDWGDGTNPQDTNLYRSAANTLKTDDNFLVQTATNSTTAFQIQNAAGANLIQVDSVNNNIVIGNSSGATRTWSTNANAITTARQNHTSVSANGYIYVIGGSSDDTYTGAQSTVYYAKLNSNGTTEAWVSTTALPQARWGAHSVVVNGYVYVVGGLDASGTDNTTVYSAKLNADGTLGSWQTTTALPNARSLASGLTANGYIYIIGSNDTSTTSYYAKANSDGTVGAWQSTTIPNWTRYDASAAANGYLYIIAGGGPEANSDTNIAYVRVNANGSLGTWQLASNRLTEGRSSRPRAVVSNGYLYVYGNSTSVEYAKLNSDGSPGTWTTSANALPANIRAQGAVVANGYIYSLGGLVGATSQTAVYYTSTPRTQIAGALDLVGVSNGTLADGEVGLGGELTAGNANIVGNLQVQGQATFAQSVSVDKELAVRGSALFKNNANSTAAFQVQDASSTTVLGVDTSGGILFSNKANSASTIAFQLKANTNLTTSGAKLLVLTNGSLGDKFSIDKDGNVVAAGGLTTSGNIQANGNYLIHNNTESIAATNDGAAACAVQQVGYPEAWEATVRIYRTTDSANQQFYRVILSNYYYGSGSTATTTDLGGGTVMSATFGPSRVGTGCAAGDNNSSDSVVLRMVGSSAGNGQWASTIVWRKLY
ncbi:MAG TPA: hypothetical protein VNA68_02165 [Candidatus Dormibacteraeota bacterium]|nr:hypothetical protein [Candidatus Dormibacteraeota bacterium]